jgi:hypothetical protein
VIAALLIYLLLLPLSVWLLGSIFNLLDHEDRAATLGRIVWRTLPLVGLALIIGSSAARPIAAALSTVLVLHVAWFFATRLILKRGWIAEPSDE